MTSSSHCLSPAYKGADCNPGNDGDSSDGDNDNDNDNDNG